MNNPSYRIAVLFPSIERGGSEQVIFNLTRGLQNLGHQVVYFSLTPPTIDLDTDLPKPYVAPTFLGNRFKALGLYHIRKAIQKDERANGEFNLILCNLRTRKPIRVRHSERLFYYLHFDNWCSLHCVYGKDPKKLQKHIHRSQLHFKDKNVLSVSHGATHALLGQIKAKPRLVKTIYNPFDCTYIQKKALAFQPPIQEPYLIHVARFNQQKRYDILLDAYRRLKNPPKLVLLTNTSDELNAMIQQYGLTGQVIQPGMQANPFPWIKNARALLLSSDYEALPTVLIEALICGTPIVSTNCPSGPNEILTDDLAKWLVPVNDPQALADKTQEVLDHPYPIEPRHYERFDMKVVLPQYISLMEP